MNKKGNIAYCEILQKLVQFPKVHFNFLDKIMVGYVPMWSPFYIEPNLTTSFPNIAHIYLTKAHPKM